MIEEHQVSKTTSQKRKKDSKTKTFTSMLSKKKKKHIYKHDLLGC